MPEPELSGNAQNLVNPASSPASIFQHYTSPDCLYDYSYAMALPEPGMSPSVNSKGYIIHD